MADVKCVTMKGIMHTLMAQVSDDGAGQLTLKNPVMVITIPPRASSDTYSIALTPFLNYAEEFASGITIRRDDVLTITTPVTDLLNQYNSIFGSGIVLASALTH